MKKLLCVIPFFAFIVGCAPELATPSPSVAIVETPSAPVSSSISTPTSNQCPEQNEDLIPEFGNLFNKNTMYDPNIEREIEQPILDFLNKGGSPDKVIDAFTIGFEENEGRFFQQDITHDKVPELIVNDFLLHIFGCRNGQYTTLLKIDPNGYSIASSWIFQIHDMNQNGIPDLIIGEWRGDINLYYPTKYRIMEWDGAHFKDLITQPEFQSRYGAGGASEGHVWIEDLWSYTETDEKHVEVSDIDNNGTSEFILRGGLPAHPDTRAHGPWRAEINIYMWNGEGFVIYSEEPATPTYRFQVIQDADYALSDGDYKKALLLYQDVISNKKLEWWSNERYFHEMQVVQAGYTGSLPPPPTPTPLLPNNSEYQYLSAYSYYRMMTIYAKLENSTEAKLFYEILKEQYPHNIEGYVFSKLATTFWDEFLSTSNLASACSKAIEFTNKNTFEIFNYLGDVNTDESYDWINHGWDNGYYYTINDICPFK
jgi:hypothetical protein